MSERILDVYLKDDSVGQLKQNQSGVLTFTYSEAYISKAQIGLSISLPLQFKTFKGNVVKAFFSGLLPEESVRDRLASYLGLSRKNPFALLESVGGDCAGALTLYPQGERPIGQITGHIEVLDNTKLREILDLIKHRPMLAGDDGYRLSLAGAQDKLVVGFKDGHVLLIRNGAPTTHILKPVINHVKDSVHNELFCMYLAKRVGLNVPEASLHFVGDRPYYLVARYDRRQLEDGTVERIHQEDFCQALGIVPEMKYEREGGPSIAKCQGVIGTHVAHPAADQIKLLDMIIFNYLIGNADAHGKNFSLLYRGAKPELAPAYDLLSTAIYPDLSEKMAMKIGGKYKPGDVCLRHWHRLVPDTKAAQSALNKQLKSMTEKIQENVILLKEQLKSDGIVSSVFDDIGILINRRVRRIHE